MCDPVTKRGVLNDFDLARFGAPDRTPSAKDNTGTLPFLALDLLNKRALDGLVKRLYRHDAESFAWCLIYICICMGKDHEGRIGTLDPHPLSSWFLDTAHCLFSKTTLDEQGLLDKFPLHQMTKPLVTELYHYWKVRYNRHSNANASLVREGGIAHKRLPQGFLVKCKGINQTTGLYNEPSYREWFREVFQLLLATSGMIPDSKEEVFFEMVGLVRTLYPFAVRLDGEDQSE